MDGYWWMDMVVIVIVITIVKTSAHSGGLRLLSQPMAMPEHGCHVLSCIRVSYLSIYIILIYII